VAGPTSGLSATRKQSSQAVLQAIIGDFHGAAVTHFEALTERICHSHPPLTAGALESSPIVEPGTMAHDSSSFCVPL